MKRALFVLCLFAPYVWAAEDVSKQAEALQAALLHSQQQTNVCNQQQLQMAVQIDALQKRVAGLELAAKGQKGEEKK